MGGGRWRGSLQDSGGDVMVPSIEKEDMGRKAGLERMAADDLVETCWNLRRVEDILVEITWRQSEILPLRLHHR